MNEENITRKAFAKAEKRVLKMLSRQHNRIHNSRKIRKGK
jgi:hypothetical protein